MRSRQLAQSSRLRCLPGISAGRSRQKTASGRSRPTKSASCTASGAYLLSPPRRSRLRPRTPTTREVVRADGCEGIARRGRGLMESGRARNARVPPPERGALVPGALVAAKGDATRTAIGLRAFVRCQSSSESAADAPERGTLTPAERLWKYPRFAGVWSPARVVPIRRSAEKRASGADPPSRSV